MLASDRESLVNLSAGLRHHLLLVFCAGAFDDEDQELLATFSKAAATIISAHPMFYKHEAKEEKEAAVALGNLDAAAVRLTATLD